MNIDTIFSLPIVQALGWALVHSLWQGIVLGLLFYLFLVIFKPESPRLIYLSVMSFMIFMLATFIYTVQHAYHQMLPATSLVSQTTQPALAFMLQSHRVVPEPSLIMKIMYYIDGLLPYILIIWFVGFILSMVRFSFGVHQSWKLKNYQTKPASTELNIIFQNLKDRLHIKKRVLLLESLAISVPMVIGVFKPVILVPAGIFTGFDQKHIEAILAHELAHVIRYDFMFNLVISFIRVVFYYHPVVWWMHAIAQQHREYCCDDFAVNITQDSRQYANAMLKLYENHLSIPRFAMTAFRSKYGILDRIKRITRKNPGEGDPLGWVLVLSVLIIGLFIMSVNAKNLLQEPREDKISPAAAVAVDEPAPVVKAVPAAIAYAAVAPEPDVEPVTVPSSHESAVPTNEPKRRKITVHAGPDWMYHNFDAKDDSAWVHFNSQMVALDSAMQYFYSDSTLQYYKLLADSMHFDMSQLDSLHFDFNNDFTFKFDSLFDDFNFTIDSMQFDVDMSQFAFDSLQFNLDYSQFALDSIQIDLDMSQFKLDSLAHFNIKIPDIQIDIDHEQLQKSLQHLDSMHVQMDSLHLWNDQNQQHLDSLARFLASKMDMLYDNKLNSPEWKEQMKTLEKRLQNLQMDDEFQEKMRVLEEKLEEQIEYQHQLKYKTQE